MNLLAAAQERPGFSPGLVLFKDHRYLKAGQPGQHLCVGNPSQAPEVRGTSNLWMAADGPVFTRHRCRCPAKKSALTGQHKCHIHPMENVTLTQKEQARLQVSNSLLAEHMTLDQVAKLMGVSERHTRRILAAYREEGAAAVAHGHRGRKAANATPDAVVTSVVSLARPRPLACLYRQLLPRLAPHQRLNPVAVG